MLPGRQQGRQSSRHALDRIVVGDSWRSASSMSRYAAQVLVNVSWFPSPTMRPFSIATICGIFSFSISKSSLSSSFGLLACHTSPERVLCLADVATEHRMRARCARGLLVGFPLKLLQRVQTSHVMPLASTGLPPFSSQEVVHLKRNALMYCQLP